MPRRDREKLLKARAHCCDGRLGRCLGVSSFCWCLHCRLEEWQLRALGRETSWKCAGFANEWLEFEELEAPNWIPNFGLQLTLSAMVEFTTVTKLGR